MNTFVSGQTFHSVADQPKVLNPKVGISSRTACAAQPLAPPPLPPPPTSRGSAVLNLVLSHRRALPCPPAPAATSWPRRWRRHGRSACSAAAICAWHC